MTADRKTLEKFEGLVFTTAKMHERWLGVELEDLQQVIRVKVWEAVEAFDESRYPHNRDLHLRSWVFGAVRNKMKDLIKSKVRRDKYGVHFNYIEDERTFRSEDALEGDAAFDYKHMRHDDPENEDLALPPTLTENERAVIALIVLDYRQREIAGTLEIPISHVERAMRSIRVKMAEWEPTTSNAEIVQLASHLPQALRRALKDSLAA